MEDSRDEIGHKWRIIDEFYFILLLSFYTNKCLIDSINNIRDREDSRDENGSKRRAWPWVKFFFFVILKSN